MYWINLDVRSDLIKTFHSDIVFWLSSSCRIWLPCTKHSLPLVKIFNSWANWNENSVYHNGCAMILILHCYIHTNIFTFSGLQDYTSMDVVFELALWEFLGGVKTRNCPVCVLQQSLSWSSGTIQYSRRIRSHSWGLFGHLGCNRRIQKV